MKMYAKGMCEGTYVYMYACICVHMCAYMYANMLVYMWTCIHVFVHACIKIAYAHDRYVYLCA